MVRALSVWADALQFETTCVVRLVRHAEELGAVSRSCGANILFCSLGENRAQNVGRAETCGMKNISMTEVFEVVFFCGSISSYIIVLCSLITFAAAGRRTLIKISFALSLSSMHSIHRSF